MEIKSRFKIDDTVFYLDTGKIANSKVEEITINVTKESIVKIAYFLDKPNPKVEFYTEEMLFKNREELIKSL